MQWREIYFPLYSWNIFFVCFEGMRLHTRVGKHTRADFVMFWYVLLLVVAAASPQGVWGPQTQVNKGKIDPA